MSTFFEKGPRKCRDLPRCASDTFPAAEKEIEQDGAGIYKSAAFEHFASVLAPKTLLEMVEDPDMPSKKPFYVYFRILHAYSYGNILKI